MGLKQSRIERALPGIFSDGSRPLGDRPWITAFAPSGPEWSRDLFKALDERVVTIEDIRADVREGFARPSIVFQAERRIESPFRLPQEALKLDDGFLPPELKPSADQLAALSRIDRKHRLSWFIKSFRDRIASVFSAKRTGTSGPVYAAVQFLKLLDRKFTSGLAIVRSRAFPPRVSQSGTPEYEWVFVLKRKSADRVTEEALRKISAHLPGKQCVYFASNAAALPSGRNYCFTDVSFFSKFIRQVPFLRKVNTVLIHSDPKLAERGKHFSRAWTLASQIHADLRPAAAEPAESARLARALCEAAETREPVLR